MVDISSATLPDKLRHNLANCRKALGFTQEHLAETLGVETETISRFERGVSLPSLKTLEKLAGILGTTASNLLEEEMPRLEEANQLVAWLSPLSEQERQTVLDVVVRLCQHFARER